VVVECQERMGAFPHVQHSNTPFEERLTVCTLQPQGALLSANRAWVQHTENGIAVSPRQITAIAERVLQEG